MTQGPSRHQRRHGRDRRQAQDPAEIAIPSRVERRRGPRRSPDLPGARLSWGASVGAGVLGVVVGLAGAEAGRTAPDPVAARSPFAPGSRPAPPPRAPDHAHVVSLRGQLEAVTPTDLVVDGGVHERWILVAEDLQPRFRHDLYPETQPHLRAIEARLRALGVIRSPTP